MGFLSYLGHRGLGLILAIAVFLLGGMWFMGVTPAWLWLILAIGAAISSSYFFKTQH